MRADSKTISRIVMLVFLVAILIYFGNAVYQAFHDPISTTVAYFSSVEDSLDATGFLVRTERVIEHYETGVVDVLLSEGEKIGAGQIIANIYQDSSGPELSQQISQLEQELEQMQNTLDSNVDTSDNLKLSNNIVTSLAQLRSSVSQGNLTDLENQSSNLKTLVYQQSYTFEGNSTTLDAAIESLTARLETLNSEYAKSASSIRASESGVYSGYVDGYESILTPDIIDTLTPLGLQELARHQPNSDDTAVGKLITDYSWYFTFNCTAEDAARFRGISSVTVRFSRDISGELPMTVYSLSEEESGYVTVTLSSDRYLSNTTLLRQQTVEIIFSASEGLYIPKTALRVDEDGVSCIYTVVGVQAERKPVTIVAEGDNFFLVKAADEKKTSLRQGEEVIVSGVDLFDGKVVR